MNLPRTILAFVGLFWLHITTISQISNPTNQSTAFLEFVGWDNLGTTSKPLDIQNGWANQPINWWTQTPPIQRMTLLSNGNLGLNNTNPAVLLQASGGADVE